ncbi:MAG TPA: heme ABC transporter ATP-binding protein [Gemmatimonadales bacterium]|nr:heme ABC transporter ATP-binding protein [Gemmatimonadales bacterium]
MVELRGVSWRAGGRPILDNIDAIFAPGRFNVILGPNGAGKSTLLRIATGLLVPDTGTVRYGDRDVRQIAAGELARQRAVLSQRMELAFPLPVDDVVLIGRYPHFGRSPSRHDRDVVAQALDLVGMTGQRSQTYSTLSGGEQQKVQLARVLAQTWPTADGSATWLFLDEPTTSLDVHYQIHLLDVARGLLTSGCTVIAVLHDLNMALRYGDNFLVLDGGRVAAAADHRDAISRELIERVFRVHAERIGDPVTGGTAWQFSL